MHTLNIQRFEKRATQVHAVFVTEDRLQEIAEWCQGYVVETLKRQEDGSNVIAAVGIDVDPPNPARALVGEWIIRSPQGTFFVCPADRFWETYAYVGDVSHPDQPELPFED